MANGSCDYQQELVRVARVSISYAALCFVVQRIASFLSSLIPHFDVLKNKNNVDNWNNRVVSLIHASIMFYRASFFWMVLESGALSVSPVYINKRPISGFESRTIDLMIGYLIYDSAYEFYTNKGVPMMLAHHGMGFLSHILTRATCCGPASYYTMMIYLAEMSTPFLNVSWLLNELGHYPTLLLIIGIILVLAFFLCRVVMGPYLLYHLLTHWDGQPLWMYIINVAITIFFIALNTFWFYQLIKKAVGGGGKKKDKAHKQQ
jgi:hypothetical protein